MNSITIDVRMLSHPGIGRYIRCLLRSLLSLPSENRYILLGDPGLMSGLDLGSHVEFRECRIPIYGPKEQLMMGRYLRDTQLVHVPHFNIPLQIPDSLVVTLHDLTYFRIPEYKPFPGALMYLKWVLARMTQKAKRIICVSKHTANDLVEMYPKAKEKISVVYEAVSSNIQYEEDQIARLKEKRGLERPYILYVGSIREHKNTVNLINAFSQLRKKKRLNIDLVLAGRLDERYEAKYGLRQLFEQDRHIRHMSDITDDEISALYSGAICLSLPSKYEGFGLPVLEAMACRCPVIISDATSLPEVAGGAALMHSTDEIDELSSLLYNVLTDNNLRENLIQKGIQRAQHFSWEKAARETLEVYRDAMS